MNVKSNIYILNNAKNVPILVEMQKDKIITNNAFYKIPLFYRCI